MGATALSSTGLSAAVGVPLAFHGGDNIGTGLSRIFRDEQQNTVTYTGVEGLTGSARIAGAVDSAIPFMGGVAGAGQVVDRLAASSLIRVNRPALFSSSDLSGVEPASQSLLDAVGGKRAVTMATEGSDALRYLNYRNAEAASLGPEDIILRENPSKAAVLEEFLHGTQQKLGIVDKLGTNGLGSAETHVKDFMIRHQDMLGLSAEDVRLLQILRDMGFGVMKMEFRMKVNDLFKIGNKTIFAGTLETKEAVILKTFCLLEIDGRTIKEIQIDGEVHDGRGHRDLWTCSSVDIDRDLLGKHDVWLTAKKK